MKKVLITGGCGFIGSHIIEKLNEFQYDITVIDNLCSSSIKINNNLLKNVKFHIENVSDYQWKPKKFDLIIHLASPVGPSGILKYSGLMAKYMLDDIYHIIEGSTINKCPIIFFSTSEIYGYRETCVELKENDDKLLIGDYKVRNEYSMSKLLCEIVLNNTSKVKNIQYQIIRPFNVSGHRQLKDNGFVLPTFVLQSLNNEDITVFGNGEQLRSFTHVKDIVDGVFLIIGCKKMNQIWNIGEPKNKCSILNLAKKVKSITNSSSKIVFVDPKKIHGPLYEEAWDKIPNSNKIKNELGWKAQYSIDEIIKSVVDYYS